jgi:uncharacterized protein YbjT (DUF2867 family)
MILVTGAAGKTGRAIIKSLVNKGINVKAFVFKDVYVKEIYQLGASEVVVGNLLNLVDLKIALRDVNAVYHICPNMNPEEIAIGDIVINAVESSDCQRIVYHSVLHPQTAAMPHHWNKLKVEESLFESGLDYTILQPSAYMQNILMDLNEIIVNKVYNLPYNTESKFSFVDLTDLSEVASVVLTTPGHIGAIYELNGPEIVSMKEVIEIISKESKTDITLTFQSQRDWMKQTGIASFSNFKRNCLCKMFEYYDKYGFWGNSRILEWILGRKPTTVQQLISRKLSKNGIT